MRSREARELFRQLTRTFFPKATVIFGRQSRAAKSRLPLVSITPGAVTRATFPVQKQADDTPLAFYPSQMRIAVDLFTHGSPIREGNRIVAYENTAMDDMLAFADFLYSQSAIDWCHQQDVAIILDRPVQDLTGIVNDDNYEYRARLELTFHFTQMAVGYAGVLEESSVRYPHDRDEWVEEHTDPEGGGEGGGEGGSEGSDPQYDPTKDPDVYIDPTDPGTVYVPVPPADKQSTVGRPGGNQTDNDPYHRTRVIPTFKPLDSGGGSQELADEYLGYFTEAAITEEESE